VVASRRLGQVAELLAPLDPERSDLLLEAALDQAAAQQAWGLAEELLRLQLRLALQQGGDADRPRERLRRLASRVDDRLTLLELQQISPDFDPQRVKDLEDQLRSPRAAGGHASLGELDASEAPASNPLATP
jgi:predicted Zn-dependent peptidase